MFDSRIQTRLATNKSGGVVIQKQRKVGLEWRSRASMVRVRQATLQASAQFRLNAGKYHLQPLRCKRNEYQKIEALLKDMLMKDSGIKRWGENHKNGLRILTLNLYQRFHHYGPKGNVTIVLSQKNFTNGDKCRYSDLGLSYQSFKSTVNALENDGLVKFERGGRSAKKDTEGNAVYKDGKVLWVNIPSKITATSKLYNSIYKITKPQDTIVPVQSNIILKNLDENGDEIDAKVHSLDQGAQLSNAVSASVRQRLLKRYNTLLCESKVTLPSHTFNAAETQYRRIFINDYQSHGRIYCTALQNMRSFLRPYILINDSPVAEVDIVSSHPLLAYSLNGIDVTEDYEELYSLPNIPVSKIGTDEEKANRKILKAVLVRLLNTASNRGAASSLKRWCRCDVDERRLYLEYELSDDDHAISMKRHVDVRSLAKKLPGYKQESVDADDIKYECRLIVDAMAERHEPITNWFNKITNAKISFIESNIILDVIDYFTNINVPVIAIHDSLVIAEEHEQELKDVLLDKIQTNVDLVFAKPNNIVEVIPPKQLTDVDEIKMITNIDKIFITDPTYTPLNYTVVSDVYVETIGAINASVCIQHLR